MLIKELMEMKDYDPDHKCLTPGAMFTTHQDGHMLTLKVKLPKHISLPDSEEDAQELEVDLHYAIEGVLKRLWK
jgi:hypothetical protein